jgi:hypothetical protein
MSLATDLRKYLLSKSAVTSVIGTRMFAAFHPQKNSTYPLVTYQVIVNTPAHHLLGGAGYSGTRIQLDGYAPNETDRDALTELLRNQLQGFPAPGASNVMGSTTVDSVVLMGQRDFYEPPQNQADSGGLFRTSMDFWFRHQQAAPTFAA